jgi:hypothetical protein
MTAPNGHAEDPRASTCQALPAAPPNGTPARFSSEEVKALVAELEVPFQPSQIEWRVAKATDARGGNEESAGQKSASGTPTPFFDNFRIMTLLHQADRGRYAD